jgi:hypothetical protein
LLKAGAKDIDDAALTAASRGNVPMLKIFLDTGKVGQDTLDAILYAVPENRQEAREALVKAGAKPLAEVDEAVRKAWMPLAGTYGGLERQFRHAGRRRRRSVLVREVVGHRRAREVRLRCCAQTSGHCRRRREAG